MLPSRRFRNGLPQRLPVFLWQRLYYSFPHCRRDSQQARTAISSSRRWWRTRTRRRRPSEWRCRLARRRHTPCIAIRFAALLHAPYKICPAEAIGVGSAILHRRHYAGVFRGRRAFCGQADCIARRWYEDMVILKSACLGCRLMVLLCRHLAGFVVTPSRFSKDGFGTSQKISVSWNRLSAKSLKTRNQRAATILALISPSTTP